MIFVTVGTHEQQFNRLIKEVDSLKEKGLIQEEVFIQTGYSDYIPKNCSSKQFLTYDEMEEMNRNADIIITHGGPATFMNVISKGKTPIVVPRQKKFAEHVNDHQVEFVKKISQYGEYKLYIVEDINSLSGVIEDYNSGENKKILSNNLSFNKQLDLLIEELFV